MFRIALGLALTFSLVGISASPVGADDMGGLSFANSGAVVAQPAFLRGLFLLHNFEYPDAATAFREAQAADPNFALAFWGEAMTYNHAVWFEQDAAKGRAALTRLAPSAAVRIAKAPTDREKAYMTAVEALYGDGNKNERDLRYAEAMAALHARFPDDVDGTAFYALSLLGTAHGGRDVPTYMRSAALLEDVYPQHRDHPGVLHYMIHSYDDPAHAVLGLRAARLYGRFATQAPHAIHMTSHIFIALGMWDEVIRANVDAMRYVNGRRAATGRPPAACGHYDEWLLYAYLQKRRFSDAETIVRACETQVAQRAPGVASSFMNSAAEMVTRSAIERGALSADAARREWTLPDARFKSAYGEALLGALHGTRAVDAALRMTKALSELRALPHEDGTPERTFVAEDVMMQQVAALGMLVSGNRDAAVAALHKAAADEAQMPVEFGPPAVIKPTYELLGDILLRAGRREEAAAAYHAALRAYPGRTLSLEGVSATGAPTTALGR